MVQTADLQGTQDTASAGAALVKHLITLLEANNVSYQTGLPNENNTSHE